MKRMVGLICAIVGGVIALWGGICVLTGQSKTHVTITPDISINAITGGLIGLAVFTLGLLWVRD